MLHEFAIKSRRLKFMYTRRYNIYKTLSEVYNMMSPNDADDLQ